MNLGQAIEILKNGGKVARDGWNGKGMFLFLGSVTDFACSTNVRCGVSRIRPCILMKDAQDMIVPGWAPSQPDMLAEDWIEL